jgi:hypothetical protein
MFTNLCIVRVVAINSIEFFIKRAIKFFSQNGATIRKLNFEFTPLTDEHFECTTLPDTLVELNLNGCREISERTIMLISKHCPSLGRIGKESSKYLENIFRVVLELQDY